MFWCYSQKGSAGDGERWRGKERTERGRKMTDNLALSGFLASKIRGCGADIALSAAQAIDYGIVFVRNVKIPPLILGELFILTKTANHDIL